MFNEDNFKRRGKRKMRFGSRVKVAQYFLVGLVLLLAILIPVTNVSAAQITSRAITVSNSAGAATSVSYTFTSAALPTTGTPVKSVKIEFCDAASGTCNAPSGFSSGSSTLAAQPSGLGAASSWTVNTSDTNELRITHASNSTNPSGSVSIQWNGVANPTAQNTTYYGRVTTYSDSSWTTAIDSGVVALSTAQAISLTGSVNETLTFCTGTSGITSSSCSGATGDTVSFGTFSASAATTGTSQIGVGTNAASGYSITINGATLTSGGNTITALASQTASSPGSEQFGVNLVANTTPSVGSDPQGSGTATPTANYGTTNQFRFVTGDSVASKNSSDAFRLFTVSYVVNIATNTEPGTYTATMTYICTATF